MLECPKMHCLGRRENQLWPVASPVSAQEKLLAEGLGMDMELEIELVERCFVSTAAGHLDMAATGQVRDIAHQEQDTDFGC